MANFVHPLGNGAYHMGQGPEGHRDRGSDENDWEHLNGVDLMMNSRSDRVPVFAVAGGVITQQSTNHASAKPFTYNHNDPGHAGIRMHLRGESDTYFYQHLEKLAPGLQPGQKVHAGDLLGWTGAAASGGPHLHFSTKSGKTTDFLAHASHAPVDYAPVPPFGSNEPTTDPDPRLAGGHDGNGSVPAPSPASMPDAKLAAGGGFFSKLRSFFGLEDKPTLPPVKHISEVDLSRLRDISRRVLENERKLGHMPEDENGAAGQESDADEQKALKRAREIGESLRRGSVVQGIDAGARLQQQTNIQRVQQMANEQSRRSQQLMRDIQDRNQLQANLARATQQHLNEQNVRNAQMQRQNAEQAQQRSAQRQQDIQRQQDEGRRNEQMQLAQQRSAEQARRDQQLRQEQLNRTLATVNARRPISFENHFTKPFVSPGFGGGGPPKPIWLPPHIYTAPVAPPRPPAPPPFSRPNNNVGHLFS